VGEVGLHVVEAGDGPPIVLLHGFPEFWYSWRRQLPALAAGSFKAIAPDLRGFNRSDRPPGVHSYRQSALVADVAGLIEQLAGGQADVIGHDWGGVVAWRLVAMRPELVHRLVVMNAALPAAYARELRRSPAQWLRSWYAFMFQLPWLPEFACRRNNFAALEQAWRTQPVHPGAFTPDDIAEYKHAFSGPDALTGPLNYYRAAFRHRQDMFGPPQQIAAPTMLIWGERDPFATLQLITGLEEWIPQIRIERIPDASHWVQNDVPDRVNELLLDFLKV
jgi:pimeloyl-ACP methyl ester carboxylesterase